MSGFVVIISYRYQILAIDQQQRIIVPKKGLPLRNSSASVRLVSTFVCAHHNMSGRAYYVLYGKEGFSSRLLRASDTIFSASKILCCMCFELCMMQRLPIESLTERKVVKKFQKAGILLQQWWSNQGCYSNTTCKIKHTHWMNANIISLTLGKQHDYLKLGNGVLIEIIAPSTLSNRQKSWTIMRFISHK